MFVQSHYNVVFHFLPVIDLHVKSSVFRQRFGEFGIVDDDMHVPFVRSAVHLVGHIKSRIELFLVGVPHIERHHVRFHVLLMMSEGIEHSGHR